MLNNLVILKDSYNGDNIFESSLDVQSFFKALNVNYRKLKMLYSSHDVQSFFKALNVNYRKLKMLYSSHHKNTMFIGTPCKF